MNPTGTSGRSLDRAELSCLWISARHRLERNGRSTARATIQLDDLDDSELAAICGLLGRRKPPSPKMRIKLTNLDAALVTAGHEGGLLGVLERIGGPVIDRRALRAADEDARSTLWEAAASHPATSIPGVEEWLTSLRQRGRITRLGADDPIQLLTNALDALGFISPRARSDASQPLPLPVVAASRFGDAHALDPETQLGALVADAVTHLAGTTDIRASWQFFGVQLDQVNSTVLTFHLPGMPGSILAAACSNNQPLRITHRMLDNDPGLELGRLDEVWVCENPAVLTMAADRLGPKCRPMICTDGMPATVAGRLLALLESTGTALRVHTDLDVGGVAITNHLVASYRAVPWRMTATDYVESLQGPTTALTETVAATPWDPDLAEAMNRHRRAVHEEAIIAILLDDLRQE